VDDQLQETVPGGDESGGKGGGKPVKHRDQIKNRRRRGRLPEQRTTQTGQRLYQIIKKTEEGKEEEKPRVRGGRLSSDS